MNDLRSPAQAKRPAFASLSAGWRCAYPAFASLSAGWRCAYPAYAPGGV
ncbi:hypothetical protein QEG60_002675 [Pluralibacter gergoviae]|nr:hypothetical protein [Pluralibacter gergoviae]EKT9641595.1 hypothetical protein [Pluralibacter gergoviae]EKV3543989.1 hypothetical protein [Pluralibacter gergoviae]EKV9901310.1 hypothetical protein [Pluralibacter gergoviae]EKV9929856.1 hypothetical protein [Pluralibacter gergoviae]EKW9974153.1 hypothetical protein [Pluralibacter gergoviae]